MNVGTNLNLPTTIDDVNIRNYINGEWVEPSSGKYLDNFNPASGNKISPIPDSGAADIESAVKAAKEAFPKWSKTPASERAKILIRVAELIEANNDILAKFESIDQGKPVISAATLDMPGCAGYFRQFAEYITKGIEETLSSFNTVVTPSHIQKPVAAKFSSRTQHVPSGVAGLITPWNFPLLMAVEKIAPCISVGNTCILKPTELTSITPFLLTKILDAAGVPKGVVNVVFGTGVSAGEPLVKHKDVRIISFTGGSATGSKIGATAGGLYKRVSLELGGKNPSVIFDDCDFEHALATTVRGAYQNQGEICLCTSRVYIQKGIYERFINAFRAKVVDEVRFGDPSKPATFFGPVVSKQHQEKIAGYIKLAKSEGANVEFLVNENDESVKAVATDGKATIAELENGSYIAPTLITNISQKSRVMQEEIFGPVVCILPFDTEEDGIALANDTQYGLGAVVWTEDKERLCRVQEQLNAGVVWGNSWLVTDSCMPFGGMGCSGTSREHGPWSLEFYTETKAIYKYEK